MQKSKIVEIVRLYEEYSRPQRKAFSSKYPKAKPLIIFFRRVWRKVKNVLSGKIAKRKGHFLRCVIARHQSVLRRKLGTSEARLQKQKIINLKRACTDLNSLIIQPGEIFSLWETLGKPSKKRGYTDGMLLSNGKVIEGMGGGLCQLSNFLCWIFLHAETEIVERQHHSMDVFPDSGRVLPFGSGATCLYNFVDLKIKNVGKVPLQIKIWVTDKHLKGQILSSESSTIKFSLREKNHAFIKKGNQFFRYNEIWRFEKKGGKILKENFLFANFAPVLYKVTSRYLAENNYEVVLLDKHN